jgi:hypothetical protein
MSFNSEHMNPGINLDNYEEFFIMYMDNELDPEQVQMVEDFILLHPELRAELDLLMGTKLPAEELSFDKTSLLSSNFKAITAEEDLLLYIDNEIPADKKKIIEFELGSNPAYKQQHLILAKTKLDPSEVISYPDKKELYRHEGGRMRFGMWMRIAAIFLLIASVTVLYLSMENEPAGQSISIAGNIDVDKTPVKNIDVTVDEKNQLAQTPANISSNIVKQENIQERLIHEKSKPIQTSQTSQTSTQLTAKAEVVEEENFISTYNNTNTRTASIEIHQQSFNRALVTEQKADAYNQITASVQPAVFLTDAAGNNETKKGSLKGLLRKASRFVEKTTGLDPTNEDEELLIGVVALKLK